MKRALREGLEPMGFSPAVEGVRVMGAVGAVEMKNAFDLEAARARFIDRGVFIRPIGKVIYLTPAHTIAEDELDRLIGAIAAEVEYLTKKDV